MCVCCSIKAQYLCWVWSYGFILPPSVTSCLLPVDLSTYYLSVELSKHAIHQWVALVSERLEYKWKLWRKLLSGSGVKSFIFCFQPLTSSLCTISNLWLPSCCRYHFLIRRREKPPTVHPLTRPHSSIASILNIQYNFRKHWRAEFRPL